MRPGRSVELVEVVASQYGRDVVILRAWLMKAGSTAALAATPLSGIPAREDVDPWDPRQVWPGGFIDSVGGRRLQFEPGRAQFDNALDLNEPAVMDDIQALLDRGVDLTY